jgi:hypothetical protein
MVAARCIWWLEPISINHVTGNAEKKTYKINYQKDDYCKSVANVTC